MTFRVGDRVGFTDAASMGDLGQDRRVKIGKITQIDPDENYGYTVAVGEDSEVFAASELWLIASTVDDNTPTDTATDTASHDYRIGYAAGFFYRVAYVLPKPERTPDYCAGFAAGIDKRHANEKAEQLALLVA